MHSLVGAWPMFSLISSSYLQGAVSLPTATAGGWLRGGGREGTWAGQAQLAAYMVWDHVGLCSGHWPILWAAGTAQLHTPTSYALPALLSAVALLELR